MLFEGPRSMQVYVGTHADKFVLALYSEPDCKGTFLSPNPAMVGGGDLFLVEGPTSGFHSFKWYPLYGSNSN